LATPAAAGRIRAVLHGDVIVDHHRDDLDVLVLGEFGGHLEVEHVAGVVLHDVHDAGTAGYRGRRGEDLVGHR
jgi:hypothetical protein